MLYRKLLLRVSTSLLIPCCLLASPADAFEPHAIPLPIMFEASSTKFTELGKRSAEDLLAALREQSPPAITLVGHADCRGDAQYNLQLSERRAKVLAKFLTDNGVTTKIEIVAKGKSEPFQLSDRSQYTRSEIWALNRRVEWQRAGTPPTSPSQVVDKRC